MSEWRKGESGGRGSWRGRVTGIYKVASPYHKALSSWLNYPKAHLWIHHLGHEVFNIWIWERGKGAQTFRPEQTWSSTVLFPTNGSPSNFLGQELFVDEEIFLKLILEREKERNIHREGERIIHVRERHQWVASHMCPNLGIELWSSEALNLLFKLSGSLYLPRVDLSASLWTWASPAPWGPPVAIGLPTHCCPSRTWCMPSPECARGCSYYEYFLFFSSQTSHCFW